MTLTEKKCFEIAIQIVKQHDKEHLLVEFQKTLTEIFPTCSVVSYNIVNNAFTEEPEQHSALLEQSILSQKIFYSEKDKLFIFPISSLGKVSSLISLQGQGLSERSPLLEQLMDLYNNQQLLLDNNNHDALTGLLNRHSFEKRIARVVGAYQRRNNENTLQYCFAILDIDFFKRVNDDFGHLYGDEVLILFANIMETTFRHDDMLFRYGGEEFAVLLRDIKIDTAMMVLNRFRENIANYQFPQVGSITVSIGAIEISEGTSRVDVISNADQALYFSKGNGRNQVNSFEELISTGRLLDKSTNVDDIELF